MQKYALNAMQNMQKSICCIFCIYVRSPLRLLLMLKLQPEQLNLPARSVISRTQNLHIPHAHCRTPTPPCVPLPHQHILSAHTKPPTHPHIPLLSYTLACTYTHHPHYNSRPPLHQCLCIHSRIVHSLQPNPRKPHLICPLFQHSRAHEASTSSPPQTGHGSPLPQPATLPPGPATQDSSVVRARSQPAADALILLIVSDIPRRDRRELQCILDKFHANKALQA